MAVRVAMEYQSAMFLDVRKCQLLLVRWLDGSWLPVAWSPIHWTQCPKSLIDSCWPLVLQRAIATLRIALGHHCQLLVNGQMVMWSEGEGGK